MSTYCNHYKKDDCNCYDKKKYDGYDKKHDHYDYDKKKKDDCRAILECGKEFFRTLPSSYFNAITNGDTPIPLAEVTIDTRKLRKPCVKIEYSSIINTILQADADPAPSASLTLTFRLVRKCKGEDEEELRVWSYERSNSPVLVADNDNVVNAGTLTIDETYGDTFTVTFCECFDRPCCDEKAGKCCTYILQLVLVDPINATYTINEKDISAMAACTSCVY